VFLPLASSYQRFLLLRRRSVHQSAKVLAVIPVGEAAVRELWHMAPIVILLTLTVVIQLAPCHGRADDGNWLGYQRRSVATTLHNLKAVDHQQASSAPYSRSLTSSPPSQSVQPSHQQIQSVALPRIRLVDLPEHRFSQTPLSMADLRPSMFLPIFESSSAQRVQRTTV